MNCIENILHGYTILHVVGQYVLITKHVHAPFHSSKGCILTRIKTLIMYMYIQ